MEECGKQAQYGGLCWADGGTWNGGEEENLGCGRGLWEED